MAGIQGMASPQDITPIAQNMPQAAPQPAPIPNTPAQPEQAARPSLDDIFASSETPASKPSLDEIFSSPDEAAPSFGSMVKDSFMHTPLGMAAEAVGTGLEHLHGATKGLASSIAEGLSGKTTSPVVDLTKGFLHPEQYPEVSKSIEKVAPATAKPMTVKLYTDASGIPSEVSVKPSEALDLVASMIGDTALLKGVTKMAEVTKLAKYAGSAAEEATSLLTRPSALNKVAEVADPAAKVTEGVDSVLQASQRLEDMNLKVPLLKSAYQFNDPKAMQLAKVTADSKAVQDATKTIGDKLNDTITGIAKSFANLGGEAKGSDEIFQVVKNARDAEGKIIGTYRDEAAKALGSKQLDINNLKDSVASWYDKATNPDAMKNLKLNEDEVRAFTSRLEQLYNDTSSGKMDLNTAIDKYNAIKANADAAFTSNRSSLELKNAWADMRRQAGADIREMIGQGLGGDSADSYAKTNASFSKIAKASASITSLLDKGEVTSNSLARRVFFSDASSPDTAKAVFDILGEQNPKLIGDLRGHAFNELMFKHTSPEGIDWKGLYADVNKLAGAEPKATNLLDLMTGSKANSQALKDALTLADAHARGGVPMKAAIPSETTLSRILYYGYEAKLNQPSSWIKPFVSAMKRSGQVEEMLSTAKPQDLLKAFPPSQRVKGLQYIQDTLRDVQ